MQRMEDLSTVSASDAIRDRVRKAAPATLIGAGLMLYFGFVHLARPSGDDLFNRAGLVLYYTLRLGGVALAGITVLLFLGWLGALALDAAIAIPTGAILMGCAAAMMLDGGGAINSVILILCGGSFISSGWRNAQEFLQIRQGRLTRRILIAGGDESTTA